MLITFSEKLKNLFRPGTLQHTMEDLDATGKIDTTVRSVNMYADNWVELVSNKEQAKKGDAYVKLDHGVLTVNQINALLNSLPLELTYADSNNQFIYYNYHLEKEDMLADRDPAQVGNPLSACHPDYAVNHVDYVIQQLRNNEIDTYRINAPNPDPEKFVVHNYTSIKDDDDKYMGVNEYVHDLEPMIEWYLEQTGQELVQSDNDVDAVSSASQTN
jgi:DUF438 domain-containing protein